eukprot:6893457-Prymnesium_polylepis.1
MPRTCASLRANVPYLPAGGRRSAHGPSTAPRKERRIARGSERSACAVGSCSGARLQTRRASEHVPSYAPPAAPAPRVLLPVRAHDERYVHRLADGVRDSVVGPCRQRLRDVEQRGGGRQPHQPSAPGGRAEGDGGPLAGRAGGGFVNGHFGGATFLPSYRAAARYPPSRCPCSPRPAARTAS